MFSKWLILFQTISSSHRVNKRNSLMSMGEVEGEMYSHIKKIED